MAWGPLNSVNILHLPEKDALLWVLSRGIGLNDSTRWEDRMEVNNKSWRPKLNIYEDDVLYNNKIVNTAITTNNKDTKKLKNVLFTGPITINNTDNNNINKLQKITRSSYHSQQKHSRFKDRIGVWPSIASNSSIVFGKSVSWVMNRVEQVFNWCGVRIPSYSEYRYGRVRRIDEKNRNKDIK